MEVLKWQLGIISKNNSFLDCTITFMQDITSSLFQLNHPHRSRRVVASVRAGYKLKCIDTVVYLDLKKPEFLV